MALTWDDKSRKDHSGNVLSVNYKAQVPHWGEASVHPHIHYPGELFLDCAGLGIEMHPLGRVELLDALNPAEAVLLRRLEQYGNWCLEAMAVIGVCLVLSVLALVELRLVPPLIITVLYAFLSIRLEGASILDFLRCAVCFLFLKQQYFEWKEVQT